MKAPVGTKRTHHLVTKEIQAVKSGDDNKAIAGQWRCMITMNGNTALIITASVITLSQRVP